MPNTPKLQKTELYYATYAPTAISEPSSIFNCFLKNNTTTTATTTVTTNTPTVIRTTTNTTPISATITTNTTTITALRKSALLPPETVFSHNGMIATASTMLVEGPVTASTMRVEGSINNVKRTPQINSKNSGSSIQSKIDTIQVRLQSLQKKLEDNPKQEELGQEKIAFVSLNGNTRLFKKSNWKLSGVWAASGEKKNGRPLYTHCIDQHLVYMCWNPKTQQWVIKSTLDSTVARAVLRDNVSRPELSSVFWHIYSSDTAQFEDSGKFQCLSLDRTFTPIGGPTWMDLEDALTANFDGVISIPHTFKKPFLKDMRKCIEKVSTLNSSSDNVWLEKLLDQIVSHKELKGQIRKFYYSLDLLTERIRRNQCSSTEHSRQHMAFLGNPGTGKTMFARIMGGILHKAEILSSGHVIEVQRGDLVAGFVGQTALKTRKQLEKAKGGVLFVDEAYRLFSSTSTDNDYGIEAIDEIMTVLDEQEDITVVFAGYPDQMNTLLDANPGLHRRFPHIFRFPDYTAEELVAIFNKKIKEAGFFVHDEVKLKSLFQLKFSSLFISKRNGGLCDLLLSRCKESLALSLHGKCQSASDLQLSTFTEDMILRAIDSLVKPAS